VLGAAEPDALGAELVRLLRVLRRVGVGAHAELANAVSPIEHGAELLAHFGHLERYLVGGDEPFAAVDRDHVALRQLRAIHLDPLGVRVDLERSRARHARLAHSPSHQRGVARLAALRGEDPPGRVEANHIIGLGELAHQDHVAAVPGRLHGVVGREHDLALRRSRRGGEPLGQHVELRVGGEARMQQGVELSCVDGADGGLAVEQPLLHGVDREAHGRLGVALGVAGLEHVEASLLHGELRVLHVAVVALELPEDLHQLLVGHGHHVLHLVQVPRRADPRHHVLPLGVRQEPARRRGLARDLVA
jgi:hypothetical protein